MPTVPTASAEDAEPPRSVLRPEFPTFETLEAAAASFAHASFGVPVPIPSSSPHGSVSLSQSQSQSGVPSVARNFSESLRATTSGSVADASILKKPEDVARFLGDDEHGAMAAWLRVYEELREQLPDDIRQELDYGLRFAHPWPPWWLKR